MTAGGRDPGRVLVTGARGFVGSALVRRLHGDRVEVVTSDLAGADIACDLTDSRQTEAMIATARFGTVFHCGAVSGPMVLADRPLAIWQINATGTANLLEAARRHAVGRIVICSTTEVYGNPCGPVDETALPQPASVYAASKLAAEQVMLGYVREHSLDAVALRLSWIYGAGRKTPTMLEAMLRAAISGDQVTFAAHPDDITHYLPVDDAVDGLLCAARAAVLPQSIYNITTGHGLPLRDIVGCIAHLRPQARIGLSGAPSRSGGPTVIDNRRAVSDLGYRPSVPPAVGLRRYLEALMR